jgi:hypothetical protein
METGLASPAPKQPEKKSEKMTQKNLSPEERRKATLRAAARYGGLAFELLGACLAGVFIGRWADAKIGLENPHSPCFSPSRLCSHRSIASINNYWKIE